MVFRVGRGNVPAHLAEILAILMGFRVRSVGDTKMQEQKSSLTNEAEISAMGLLALITRLDLCGV